MFADSATAASSSFVGEQPMGVVPVHSAVPSAGPPMAESSQQAATEEIRTIFISGFPANVHERELHNFVYCLEGVTASQMNTRPAAGGSPQGFVLFSTVAQAQAAVRFLHDLEFDMGCHLRCELAHKNMYLREDPTIRRVEGRVLHVAPTANGHAAANGMVIATVPVRPGVRQITINGQPYTTAQAGTMGLAGSYGGPLLASSLAALRPAAGSINGGGGLLPPPGSAAAMAAQQAGLMGMAPVAGFGPVTNRHDNPPCNTLFVGNLGDGVDEKELTALFACQPGYKQLKLLRQPRHVSCFVEFMDTPSAVAVHSMLQGALLPSSSRGPIRIQFSKNPYGRRSPQGSVMGMVSVPVSLYGPLTMQSGGAAGAPTALFDTSGMTQGGMPGGMASVIMAASGGEYCGWPQSYVMQ